MIRKIIAEGRRVDAIRETNTNTTRTLSAGSVLNMLQWVRPGLARFTVEGEGADVWFCDQLVIERNTL